MEHVSLVHSPRRPLRERERAGSLPLLSQVLLSPQATPHKAPPTTYIVSSSLDLLIESVLVLVPERGVPHQQNVENNTCKGEDSEC